MNSLPSSSLEKEFDFEKRTIKDRDDTISDEQADFLALKKVLFRQEDRTAMKISEIMEHLEGEEVEEYVEETIGWLDKWIEKVFFNK